MNILGLISQLIGIKTLRLTDTMHKDKYDISSLDIEEAFQTIIPDRVDVISVSFLEECSYLNRV